MDAASRGPVLEQLARLNPNAFGHLRIELCGGIGSGKSTVAKAVAAAWSLPLVSESYANVPFWEKYYREPHEYELEKNVSFLLAYGDSIRSGLSAAKPQAPVVFDFALFQVLGYSDLSASREDRWAVEVLYQRLVERLGTPSLIIHVRCPVDVQLERIQRRGRPVELGIESSFLAALNSRIADRVCGFAGKVPVIEVDSQAANFIIYPNEASNQIAQLLIKRDHICLI